MPPVPASMKDRLDAVALADSRTDNVRVIVRMTPERVMGQ